MLWISKDSLERASKDKPRVISYSDVAKQILYPKAVRAVASAIGKNPISIIVPCHRVIRKNGMIGDYAWGVKMKRALLDVEV